MPSIGYMPFQNAETKEMNLQSDRYERDAASGRSNEIRYLSVHSRMFVLVWCRDIIGETLAGTLHATTPTGLIGSDRLVSLPQLGWGSETPIQHFHALHRFQAQLNVSDRTPSLCRTPFSAPTVNDEVTIDTIAPNPAVVNAPGALARCGG